MIAPAIAIAQHFGDCLTQADYETAYSLLSPELQLHSSPHTLQHTVETMIAYGSGPILQAIAMTDCLLTEWQYPPREPQDVLWIYISLEGQDFMEAVSVIVRQQGEKFTIRWLEWGRP